MFYFVKIILRSFFYQFGKFLFWILIGAVLLVAGLWLYG